MPHSKYPLISAEEAAANIPSGATVAFSGFSSAGSAKVVPRAIAKRARSFHHQGESYRIRVLTGGSTGKSIDEELAGAEAISWRAPYQSSPILRSQINRGEVEYLDIHLSHVPQMVANGFFGKLDFAVMLTQRPKLLLLFLQSVFSIFLTISSYIKRDQLTLHKPITFL